MEKYTVLDGLVDSQSCKDLLSEMKKYISEGKSVKDQQCPNSDAMYGAPFFDSMLEQLRPAFEQVSGKRLLPTYSYARLYKKGEVLAPHLDRESCEISATITLGFSDKTWPIFFGDNKDGSLQSIVSANDMTNITQVDMTVGDAILYKGMEKYHWREELDGDWHAQVFLHYVDADGKYANKANDNRMALSHKSQLSPYICAQYDDILSADACEKLIVTYTTSCLEAQPPTIGDNKIDKSIRDVERFLLPTHKDIGGRLAAAALDANKNWKFDITEATQSEFLTYKPDGHYVGHIDTFLNPKEPFCRKLTALAFLNDNFDGGKFFFMLGHEKIYPEQKAGTVLVFPSFLVHGVEKITSGIRYSVVTWMSGPWFK